MDKPYRNCPNCFCAQPFENKKCALCGEKMKNINSMTAKNLISVIKDVVIIFGVLLLLAQFILPAPYNPSYLVKKALYKPTALCADETYIFTFPPSENSCSNHGGIVKMFLENLKEIDLKREQMSRE